MAEVRISELIAPTFLPVHRDIRTHGHREYWLQGGRGSTKSSFIATEIILGMLRDPDANAVVYRRVAETLRESVYEEFMKVIGRMELNDWFLPRLSPLEIRYKPTYQKILFRGADDPGKSKSISTAKGYFKYLWFEELAEFRSMDDIRTIRASVIRGMGSDNAVTLYSYNPPRTATAWVNAEALHISPGRLVHRSTYLDVPPHWLGKGFLSDAEALRAADERAYRHMYLGEITGTGCQVFDNLRLQKVTPDDIRHFGQTYAGLDWGWWPDPTHFVRCAYDPHDRRLTIYDEYRTVKTGNGQLYEYLVQEKQVTPYEEVIADSADIKSIHDMRAFGMNCTGATKGPGSVRAGIRWLQSLREIVIDPERCPATAKEFLEYEYEKTRDGMPVYAFPDKNNHAIDAVRYAMNRVWLRAGS